ALAGCDPRLVVVTLPPPVPNEYRFPFTPSAAYTVDPITTTRAGCPPVVTKVGVAWPIITWYTFPAVDDTHTPLASPAIPFGPGTIHVTTALSSGALIASASTSFSATL